MSAPTPIVLRGDATLVGQNLFDIYKTVRGETPLPEEDLLARFSADVPLGNLSDNELSERLETLTGQDTVFLLAMTGMDPKAHETIVRLAHFLILAANDTVAPRQQIQPSKASKTAAQAVANLLDPTHVPPRGTERATTAAASKTDGASSSGLPPPAKKAKKKKPAPPEEDSSSGDESDLEDDSLRRELDKAKEACLDPLVHRYPAKLHGPLCRLKEKAIRVGAKRSVVERFENLANFVLENSSNEGIGEEVRILLMTTSERRFMAEAKKAKAALASCNRQPSYGQPQSHRGPPPPGAWGPPPPGAWGPPQGPPQPYRQWGQGSGAEGWGPPPRRSSARPPRIHNSDRCFTCGEVGHWRSDCPLGLNPKKRR
ncbi:uncharacterized protein LOC144862167 [Branchiostoma floridae x Branchiostoma japonicum]